MEIIAREIESLIFEKYDPKLEYSDDILLEFNCNEDIEVYLKDCSDYYEESLYCENNILITRVVSDNHIYYDLEFNYFLSKSEQERVLRTDTNLYKQLYFNYKSSSYMTVYINLRKNYNIIEFIKKKAIKKEDCHWSYLNYLANRFKSLIQVLLNERITIDFEGVYQYNFL